MNHCVTTMQTYHNGTRQCNGGVSLVTFIPEMFYAGQKFGGDMREVDVPVFYEYGPGALRRGRTVLIVIENNLAIVSKVVEMHDVFNVLWNICTVCAEFSEGCACDEADMDPDEWHLIGRSKDLPPRRNEIFWFERRPYYQLQTLKSVIADDAGSMALKLIEDVATMLYQWRRARDPSDACVAVGAFVRSVTGQSLTCLAESLFLEFTKELACFFMLQSGDSWSDRLEDVWNNYSSAKNSVFSAKLFKVVDHVVAKVIFVKIGIPIDDERFEKLERVKLRPSFAQYTSFFDAVGNLIVFLLKQGRQYMNTGDINCFFISAETASVWFEKAKRAKANFEFLNNPEPVNMDVHQYLYDLRETIRDGQSLLKAMARNTVEHRVHSGMVIELESLEKRYLTLASSLTMREQPLGVVLYGEPGIGKTHLTDVLIHFYATRFGLPTSTDYRFFHNSEEEYFTNFRSYMYAIVLDDVAQHLPERVQGVDPSVASMIKIFNNMPFSPPQAAIDDKGKTPMMCKIGIVTTNVLHLNVPYYYSKSFAVMRRLPVHIEPIVKEPYRKTGGMSLDPAKTDGGIYTDYWDFIVREPVNKGNMKGLYEITQRFASFAELFAWFGPVCDKHAKNQKNMTENSLSFANVRLCETCTLPTPVCSCVQVSLVTQMEVAETEGRDSDDLFFPETEVVPRPWRGTPMTRRGPARFLNVRMVNLFVRRMMDRHPGQEARVHVAEYAHVHLPPLMILGAQNAEIEEDFEEFIHYRTYGFRKTFLRVSMSVFSTIGQKLTWVGIEAYTRFGFVRRITRFLTSFSIVRNLFFWLLDRKYVSEQSRRSLIVAIAESLDESLGGVSVLTRLAALGALLMMFSTLSSLAFGVKREVQTNVQNFGQQPLKKPGDEKKNVWVIPERTVTSIDFDSSRATNEEALAKSVGRSCVLFELVANEQGKVRSYRGRAIVLGDGLLVNSHAIPNVPCQVTVYHGARRDLAAKVSFFVDPSQVEHLGTRDLAYVRTKALPTTFGGKLKNNFVKDSFDGSFDGFYLIRQEDGSFKRLRVARIRRKPFRQVFDGTLIETEMYTGTPQEPTSVGDCGSPLFMDTGYGPVVVGIHSVYVHNNNITMATALTQSDVLKWCDGIRPQCSVIDVRHEMVEVPVSFYDFHEDGGVMYHGEMALARVRPKSHVAKTEIHEHLVSCPTLGDFRFTDKFSAPMMHSWFPQQKSLKEYMHPADMMNEAIVARCAAVLLDDILRNLPSGELELVHTYPLEVAINGMPGMAYVDGIKRSTSMGYPYHTSKRKYLVPIADDRWQDGVTFTPEVLEKIQNLMDKYCRGERGHPVFSANLKDEVVSKTKAENGKTRVFFSCPVDFLCVVRMIFLGFTRVVQRNWSTFHCVIGVNVHSDQWEEVERILTKFGRDKMIAGDFAGFDKKFMVSFMRWAFWVIKQICNASGNFSEEEKLVMECIEADLVNPTVNWFGMLITLCGGEVSGHQLTTVFNCFCCVLYIMYSYATVYPVESFFFNVSILSLGDDHVVGVSPDCPLFTHTHIQRILESVGVGYTMAEKEKESVPYIPMDEVTFLKRKFMYHDGVQGIVGPLEKDSIMKMLLYQVVGKTCSKAEALAQAMVSASMESFYHGREFFEFIERCLQEVQPDFELEEHMKQYPRLTWDQNVERFHQANHAAEALSRNQTDLPAASYCSSTVLDRTNDESVELQVNVTRAFPEVPFQGRVRLLPKHGPTRSVSEPTRCGENQQLAETSKGVVSLTKDAGNHSAANPERMVPNEGPGNASTAKDEVVTFADEKQPVEEDLSGEMDPTVHRAIKADLATFLSRPTKITQFIWDLNGPNGLFASFRPWGSFLNATIIKRKLENFAFIRCKLHLKFILNASPFYYGSVGAFYEPLSGYSSEKLGENVGYTPGSQVLISQRQGVYLDPQSASTFEMTLPFLYFRDYLELNSLSKANNFGEIMMYQFAALRSANGVISGGVTCNVYAWAEDVELSGATNVAVLQAGRDEYATGPVSRPASVVRNVARRLENVPVVGAFATATSTVAKALGDVASFFGYTNVPVVDDVHGVKPVSFHTLASTEQREPINKLSLTAKAETAIGQYPGDGSADMLAISSFCGRNSFLCGCLWATTKPEDEVVFGSWVLPMLLEFNNGTNSAVFPTPLAHMASRFQYWRGSIIFTFRVVKSKYHRGRLSITWDPLGEPMTMPATGQPSAESVIMDLDECSEIEIRVPYLQADPFLLNWALGKRRHWTNAAGAPDSTAGLGISNGYLEVRVLNPLTAPVSAAPVEVLVFVRGGSDFELAAPRDVTGSWSLMQLQSDVTTIGDDHDVDQGTYGHVFGEKVVSMRAVLHRQSQAWVQVFQTNPWISAAGYATFWFKLNRMPRPYGFCSSGTETIGSMLSTGPKPAFICYNHPMLWMTSCFVGYKGSVNYTVNPGIQSTGGAWPLPSVSVFRPTMESGTLIQGNQGMYRIALDSNLYSAAVLAHTGAGQDGPSGAGGALITNQHTQAGVMVNLPYYHNFNFHVMNLPDLYTVQGTAWGQNRDCFVCQVRRKVNGTAEYSLITDVYCGTGPDFDVVYFLNCPPVYAIALAPV